MNPKNKYLILMFFFVLNLIISVILAFSNQAEICSIEGCNLVLNSKYSSFLGIKNSIYGISAFLILSIITLLQLIKPNRKRELLINLLIFLGSIIALYFIFLQIFIIKSFCKYCLVIDIGMLIALSVITPWKKK